MTNKSQPKIVSIGDLTADLVMPVKMPVVAHRPQEMSSFSVEPGGSGNFLIMGQRLGGQMATLGAIGDDMFGRHVREVLHSEGVDVAGIYAGAGTETTIVCVLVEPESGEFTFVWYGGHGEPVPVDDHAIRVIDQADALFMQGFTLYEASLRLLVEHALASGKPIWFDVGPGIFDVPEAEREQIRQRVQVILTTEDELPLIANKKSGKTAIDFLMKFPLEMLVVKRGAAGCWIFTKSETLEIPAFNVKARDLIGAGDCFNATLIYGSVRGLSPYDAARLANAAGAAKVQKLGTGRFVPTRAEVQAVLEANGITFNF
jgi:sugar/nucleoside kinase (ribokinase family)